MALPPSARRLWSRSSHTLLASCKGERAGEGSSLLFGHTSPLLTLAGHSHPANLAAGMAGKCRVTATLVPGGLDEGESG